MASPVLEAPHHLDDQGHMDRSGDLKRLLLPTRDDAVSAVCPPPDNSQSVEVYRSSQMNLPHSVRQSGARSNAKIRDRSKPNNPPEQGNETIVIPPAPEKRHDLPILDIQQEPGSHGEGSFDDGHRGGGLPETPDGEGPLGWINDDARLSQRPSKPPVPEVVLIPPTRPTSPIHNPLGAVPPENPRIARAHREPSRRVPTPPEPVQPPRRQPLGSPRSSSPTTTGSVRRKKRSILYIICPCLG